MKLSYKSLLEQRNSDTFKTFTQTNVLQGGSSIYRPVSGHQPVDLDKPEFINCHCKVTLLLAYFKKISNKY